MQPDEYRQRAESMLRGSNRVRESILNDMRRKHRALFQPRHLIALEHEEAPRFAIIDAADPNIRLVTDPGKPGARWAHSSCPKYEWVTPGDRIR